MSGMYPLTDEMATLRLQRTLTATPDRVFAAWLDPDLLPEWLSTAELRVQRAETQARHRGPFRLWHIGPDGADAGGIEARIMEFEPDRKLVFRWGFCGPERIAGPIHDSILTVRLNEAEPGSTDLHLIHEQLGALRREIPDLADDVPRHWSLALGQLEDLLATDEA